MKSNYWSVNVLADAVPDKYVLQCCSIYSDPRHIGVLCTQVILPLHLAPSRHFLQFMVPVWPIPLHSLSVLKGMTPHSHTITCCLSHTLTLSSCLSKSLSHRCIHISLPLSFLLSLFPAATGVMLPYILHQLINGLPGDSYNTPASLFCQSHQTPNFISTLPTSDAWLFLTVNSLPIWHYTTHNYSEGELNFSSL